jgi:hypothetical protein
VSRQPDIRENPERLVGRIPAKFQIQIDTLPALDIPGIGPILQIGSCESFAKSEMAHRFGFGGVGRDIAFCASL